MHYDDKEVLDKQSLKIVVYIHENLTNYSFDVTYELTSIQKCQYVDPSSLIKFISNFETNKHIHKALKGKKIENFYLLDIMLDGDNVAIYNVKNVSESKNKFMRLH